MTNVTLTGKGEFLKLWRWMFNPQKWMIHSESTLHLIIFKKMCDLAPKTKRLDSYKYHNRSKCQVSHYLHSICQHPPIHLKLSLHLSLNMRRSPAKMTLLQFQLFQSFHQDGQSEDQTVTKQEKKENSTMSKASIGFWAKLVACWFMLQQSLHNCKSV